MVLTSVSGHFLLVHNSTYTVGRVRYCIVEMHSLGREIFLTRFDRSRTIGAHLQRKILILCSLTLRLSQDGKVESSFFILLALSSTNIGHFERHSHLRLMTVLLLSRTFNGRMFEYIYYFVPGENRFS